MYCTVRGVMLLTCYIHVVDAPAELESVQLEERKIRKKTPDAFDDLASSYFISYFSHCNYLNYLTYDK